MTLQEPHIMLDLDGVLADFVGGCEKLFSSDLKELDIWDIPKYIHMSPSAFWKTIQEEKYFWAELKPYPWARDVVNNCLEFTGGNVSIVTNPALDPNCAGQKIWWINHYYPGLAREFFIGPQKHLLAKPNHILIDDSEFNCKKFKEYGGKAILFPQKWNNLDLLGPNEPRADYVRKQLETLYIKYPKTDENDLRL